VIRENCEFLNITAENNFALISLQMAPV